jgi:2-dehydro-3-deoxy-D-gluconate 5-dehydrogenase
MKISHTIDQLFNLRGKAAILTGGAHWLGQACALRLAEAGAAITVFDVLDAEETCRKIIDAGGKARAIRGDVRNTADIGQAVQATVDAFGCVDILINNAGIFPTNTTVNENEAQWDRVMDVNLKGSFFFAQAVARQMKKEGHGGKIVNFSSVGAVKPAGPFLAYETSKGGVISMTRSLAKDLGELGINVNCILPGPIFSEDLKIRAPHLYEAAISHTAFKRPGTPEEIANTVLFLCTKASDYVTGAMLHVDGGFVLY